MNLCEEKAHRLESLGDNCEIGFALKEVGNEEGGLLRWARTPTKSLLALLKARFARCYEYENLSPQYGDMVYDSMTQIWFHTEMYNSLVDGQYVFNADEPERLEIYGRELQKRLAMVDKFYRRLRSGELILVIKDNDPIDSALIDEIENELLTMAEGATFQLLQMRIARDGEPPGSLIKVAERRLEGTVAFFAPYHLASEIDHESWRKVLGAALA